MGTNAGALVLIGDMLLSVEDPRVRSDLHIPSQPQGVGVPPRMTATHIPVAARRKTFVVNDHLAVGVAGSVPHIGLFLNELIGQFRRHMDFTLSDIDGFLTVIWDGHPRHIKADATVSTPSMSMLLLDRHSFHLEVERGARDGVEARV